MNPSTYEQPHTFEEAKQFLAEGNHIDYEVRLNDAHGGALMTREEWLEEVGHMFTDYDGMGNEVAEDGTVLGVKPHVRDANGRITEVGDPGWIKPSQAARIRPETKYILWYNK